MNVTERPLIAKMRGENYRYFGGLRLIIWNNIRILPV